MRHRFLTMILVVMAMSGDSLLMSRADNDQPEGLVDHLLPRNIIVVSTKSSTGHGATLQKVTAKQIGDQTFIVGKAIERGHPRDWQKNQTVWINVDDISQFTEFPDAEEMKTDLSRFQRQSLKFSRCANRSLLSG